MNDLVGILKDMDESSYAAEEPRPLHANSGIGTLDFLNILQRCCNKYICLSLKVCQEKLDHLACHIKFNKIFSSVQSTSPNFQIPPISPSAREL
jgi:hypothetical protein